MSNVCQKSCSLLEPIWDVHCGQLVPSTTVMNAMYWAVQPSRGFHFISSKVPVKKIVAQHFMLPVLVLAELHCNLSSKQSELNFREAAETSLTVR